MPHVTFVHGIANKPPMDKLLNEWKVALSDNDGVDLDAMGVTSSMVYWADLLYAHPAPEAAAQEATQFELEDAIDADDADVSWLDDLPADQRDFVEALGVKFGLADATATPDELTQDAIVPESPLEAVPLPGWLKTRLMRILLRDVHHYLYDVPFSPRPGETFQIRTEIRHRVLDALEFGDSEPGPHLLLGHSLGTVIAYDALTAIDGAPRVDALVTAGSPLGIPEIREGLTPPWTADDGWPAQRLGDGNWWNVFDVLDPVCGFLDHDLARHYRRKGQARVADIGVSNTGFWRHSIGKYLGQPTLRSIITEIFG